MIKNTTSFSSTIVTSIAMAILCGIAGAKPQTKPNKNAPAPYWTRRGHVDFSGFEKAGNGGWLTTDLKAGFDAEFERNGGIDDGVIYANWPATAGPFRMSVQYVRGDDKGDAAINGIQFKWCYRANVHSEIHVTTGPGDFPMELGSVSATAGAAIQTLPQGNAPSQTSFSAQSVSKDGPASLGFPSIGVLKFASITFPGGDEDPHDAQSFGYPNYVVSTVSAPAQHTKISSVGTYPPLWQDVALSVNKSMDYGNLSNAKAWAGIETSMAYPGTWPDAQGNQYNQPLQGSGLNVPTNYVYLFGTP